MASLVSWANDKRKRLAEVASQGYDQLNVLDNGLSAKTRQINPNMVPQSAVAQVRPIAKQIVRAPAQMLNTAARQVPLADYTIRQNIAARTGNRVAYDNATRNVQAAQDMFDQQEGGLFNVGTFYGRGDAQRGDFRTGIQKIGGGTLQTGATIVPFAKGGSAGMVLGRGAILPQIPKLAATGAGYGAAYSAGYQEQETGRIDPRQLAIDTALGAAGNVALPVVGRGVANGTRAVVKDAQSLTKDQGGYIGGFGAKNFDDMKAQGKTFEGVDGKVRFEGDDSGAKILNQPRAYKLDQLLDHPELYNQYPELRDIAVKVAPLKGGLKGQYDPTTNRLLVNSKATAAEQKASILHEIQHAIQEREAFATGGAPESVLAKSQADIGYRNNPVYKKYIAGKSLTAKERAQLDSLEAKLDQQAYDNYRRLAGEAEARAVEKRADLPADQRTNFYDDLDVPQDELIIRNQQATAQSRELGNAGMGKPPAVKAAEAAAADPEIIALYQKMKNTPKPEEWNPTVPAHGGYTEAVSNFYKALQKRGINTITDQNIAEEALDAAVAPRARLKFESPADPNLQAIQQADNTRPMSAEQTAYENAKNAGDTAAMANAGKDLDSGMRGEYTLNTGARDIFIKAMREGKPMTMEQAKALAAQSDPALAGQMLPPEIKARKLAEFRAQAAARNKTPEPMTEWPDELNGKPPANYLNNPPERLPDQIAAADAPKQDWFEKITGLRDGGFIAPFEDLNPKKPVTPKTPKKMTPKKMTPVKEVLAKSSPKRSAGAAPKPTPASAKKTSLPQSPVNATNSTTKIGKVNTPPPTPPKPPTTVAPTPKPKHVPGEATLPKSIRNSAGTEKKLKSIIEDSGYTIKPNKETLAKAVAAVNKNPMELVEEVMGMKVGKTTTAIGSVTGKALPDADQVAKSMVTIDYLARNGLYKQADEIVKNLTKQSTALGQAVQILAAYGRTTPAGIYKYATRLAKDAGKDLDTKTLDKLVKGAKSIEDMPEGRQKEVARALLLKEANEVLPSTAGDKAAMTLYLAQLLNLKTATRNIVGNAFLLGAQNIADLMAAPLDIARVAITRGQRQVYAPNLIEQGKSLFKGVKYGTEDAVKGIDSRGLVAGKWDAKQNVFRGKVGRALETALSVELSAFDRGFYQVAHDQVIRNLTRGAKVAKATPEMEAIADAFGKYMTFQDDTVLARLAVGLKKTLNLNKSFGAGNAIINYPRTPANLINRASAFSPLGFAKVVTEGYRLAMKHPGATAADFEQALARAAVGTGGLAGMGYLLHDIGILQANENKDKTDVSAFQRATGGGQYTINASALKRYVESGFDKEAAKKQEGDKTGTYDWAQPLAVSLTMGANANEASKSTKSTRQKLTNSFGTIGADAASGVQTIVEQPLLQGVQRAFNAQNPLYGALDTAKAVPNSFVPALVRQTRQFTDNKARNTYSPNIFKETANLVQNSIPGASTKLPAQINPTTGKANPSIPGGENNLFNVYVNPAFISTVRGNSVTKELDRLYEQGGDAKVIPNVVQKSYQINGNTRVLSAKEYNDMQKFVGEKNASYLDQLTKDPIYKAADDTTKAKYISGLLQDVTAAAKQRYLDAKTARTDTGVDTILTGGYYKIKASSPVKTAKPTAAVKKSTSTDKRTVVRRAATGRTAAAKRRNGFQAPIKSGASNQIALTANIRQLLKNAKVSVTKV